MRTLKRLWREEQAATATEYGIIAAILAVGLIAALVFLRQSIANMFTRAAGQIANQ